MHLKVNTHKLWSLGNQMSVRILIVLIYLFIVLKLIEMCSTGNNFLNIVIRKLHKLISSQRKKLFLIWLLRYKVLIILIQFN